MDNERTTDMGVSCSAGKGTPSFGLFVGTYAAAVTFVLVVLALAGHIPDLATVFVVILSFPLGLFVFVELSVESIGPACLIGYAVYLVLGIMGMVFKKMIIFWVFVCVVMLNISGCLWCCLSRPP